MLKLIETVEREVECKCWDAWKCDDTGAEQICSECHGTGHRTVVYRVEAEVDFEEMARFNIRLYARHAPQYGEHMRSIRHGHPIALAEKLLTAYLADEELPGVTVTEVSDAVQA